MLLRTDPKEIEAALKSKDSKNFVKVAQSAKIGLVLDDLYGRYLEFPIIEYLKLAQDAEQMLVRLVKLGSVGNRLDNYREPERQFQRLDHIYKVLGQREPDLWAATFFTWAITRKSSDSEYERLPLLNRFALEMGFYPNTSTFSVFQETFADDLLSKPIIPILPGERQLGKIEGALGEFIYFFLAKVSGKRNRLFPLKTTNQRKLELIEIEEEALTQLNFLSTIGTIYHGWLMVALSFLAPYALAPEVAAAGSIVTVTGSRNAVALAAAASEISANLSGRALLFAIDIGPSFLELAIEVSKVFVKSPNKPLTPGEVFTLFWKTLGIIPSAKLGLFMMGTTLLSPLEVFQEFVDWLIRIASSLAIRVEAANVGFDTIVDDSLAIYIELDD